MIVLTVVTYNGEPANGLSATFDETGGTIGRAENNQLVLPDPERTISRLHARVVLRGGGYRIVDNGSNPVSVNGTTLGSGSEHPLNPGDRLQIGGYVLSVIQGRAGAPDPSADIFGSSPDLGRSPALPMSIPPPPALAPGQIPEDWDPFADLAPRPPMAPPPTPVAAPPTLPPLPDSLGLGLAGNAGGDSIDDLFGLAGTPNAGDPLGAGFSQASRPNTAGDNDPLRALLRSPSAPPAATLGDLGSELNTPMPLLPPAARRPPSAPSPPPPSGLPAGAILSWDQPPREGRVVPLPDAGSLRAEPTPARAARPSPASPTPAAPMAGRDELMAALLAGLDVPGLRLEALTPETMHLLGQLLRESTRGAVELLIARAALKREMRAELTMIVATENNPLKFSPSVEVALQHLLGPPAQGFMTPALAVRDAFDDLRAHQLGVTAGMKAALDGVLQRFDPRHLESRITRKSVISDIIPAARKARLWELFQELFAQLSSEAQDDFDEFFGKAFLEAYEAQLDRLQRETRSR